MREEGQRHGSLAVVRSSEKGNFRLAEEPSVGRLVASWLVSNPKFRPQQNPRSIFIGRGGSGWKPYRTLGRLGNPLVRAIEASSQSSNRSAADGRGIQGTTRSSPTRLGDRARRCLPLPLLQPLLAATAPTTLASYSKALRRPAGKGQFWSRAVRPGSGRLGSILWIARADFPT